MPTNREIALGFAVLSNIRRADAFAESLRVRVDGLRAEGATSDERMAAALNSAKVRTSYGNAWTKDSACKLRVRLTAISCGRLRH
jgi:hypothetical protein